MTPKPKAMKACKAWAHVDSQGRVCFDAYGQVCIYRPKTAYVAPGERQVRITVTPMPRTRGGKR